MKTARRDFMKYAAGLTGGMVFTPVPWKVVDDVSIWTQNWGWLPRPLRGAITEKFTNCTLCTAGCGVRAKCVAGQPYQVSGIANHPVGRPTLCPAGLAAHQSPYAAARVTTATIHGTPARIADAIRSARAAVQAAESVVMIDSRPGSCASAMYRNIAANMPHWRDVYAPGATGYAGRLTEVVGPGFGIDFARVRTIASFAAPILHGWSTPGVVLSRRGDIRLIQIEGTRSRTGDFADDSIIIRPGMEGAFAIAVAGVLLRQAPAKPASSDAAAYLRLIDRVSPERAASMAGVALQEVENLAQALAGDAPSLALAGAVTREAGIAIAGLNVLLGDKASLLPSATGAAVCHLEDLPDASASMLIADGTLPHSMARCKLRQGGTIIAVSSHHSEFTHHADIVIPAPAWLEAREDAPGPLHAAASFGLSNALLTARWETMHPADVTSQLAAAAGYTGTGTLADTIDAHIQAIHKRGLGNVVRYADGKTVPVKTMSADELATALAEGARWIDAPVPAPLPRAVRMLGGVAPDAFESALMSRGPAGTPGKLDADLIPLLAKLYQETNLYANG